MSSVNPICALCDQEEETELHLFCHYIFSKVAWQGRPWGFKFGALSFASTQFFLDFVLNPPAGLLLPGVKSDQLSLFAISVMELVWKTRNLTCMEGISTSLASMPALARKAYEDFTPVLKERQPMTHTSLNTYFPTPMNSIRINVDAAVRETKCCIAAIALDHNDVCLGTWTKTIPSCEAITAEALAVKWAIKIAIQEGWNSIFVVGDAQCVMEPLQYPGTALPWKVAVVLHDILLSAISFSVRIFGWSSRHFNLLAHVCASGVLVWGILRSCLWQISHLPYQDFIYCCLLI